MSNVPSDQRRFFQRKPVRTANKVDTVGNAVGVVLDLRDGERGLALPGRLFEQLPFAVYVCDRDGLVLRYNRRAAELWGRSPKLGDPNERYCGSYRMFRPDGSLLSHHQCPMAEVLHTGVSVRQQEVHIERPDGSRGIALVDIEAIKDGGGNVVGAVNCFQDITERKRSEVQIVNLAREAEHRTKNILSTVLATVRLSEADTSDDLKQLIEGRIEALAKVHTLFVESRWVGAELHRLAAQELLAYRRRRRGCELMAQPLCWSRVSPRLLQFPCTSSRPTPQSTARYRQRVAASKSYGRYRRMEGSACVGSSRVARPSGRPRTAGSAHAFWRI
ncbi:HWE histidine kinase domain-containing protein [Bradyrhizobium elkanii]|uniref:HWE histidine kinase domain-containing protein n=1 Tax=Bradyrhizobium elkanii TaxID=29448 RepID=UPI0009B6E7BC|nr:HWE histidine kinase domain-containing protein [Bradyrhizobium elkanii]WLA86333.1 HWE histidine kinase domain-containing protein [Bradyrhizobium elkanii]